MGIVEESKSIEQIVITDVICDRCGQSCKKPIEDSDYSFEYSRLTACWGFDSSKDGEEWDLFFCEDCSDKILKFIQGEKNLDVK